MHVCDLLQGKNLIFCKKNDAVMEYSGGSTPNDIFLAPKDHAGYVLLINTASEGEKNNCKCLRSIIQGRLRVIIYTSSPIRAGEQLLYEYGPKYRYVSSRILPG